MEYSGRIYKGRKEDIIRGNTERRIWKDLREAGRKGIIVSKKGVGRTKTEDGGEEGQRGKAGEEEGRRVKTREEDEMRTLYEIILTERGKMEGEGTVREQERRRWRRGTILGKRREQEEWRGENGKEYGIRGYDKLEKEDEGRRESRGGAIRGREGRRGKRKGRGRKAKEEKVPRWKAGEAGKRKIIIANKGGRGVEGEEAGRIMETKNGGARVTRKCLTKRLPTIVV